MKRWIPYLLFGAVALLMLAGATGCARTSEPDAVVGSPAKARSASLPRLAAGQQRVDLDGLVVTLTMPEPPTSAAGKAKLAAGKGKFVIALRADNSTDSTMAVRIYRNVPWLYESEGSVALASASGNGVGARGLVNPNRGGGSFATTSGAVGGEALAPHGYYSGYVETAYDTAGRGMSVKWTLRADKVAVFDLP